LVHPAVTTHSMMDRRGLRSKAAASIHSVSHLAHRSAGPPAPMAASANSFS